MGKIKEFIQHPIETIKEKRQDYKKDQEEHKNDAMYIKHAQMQRAGLTVAFAIGIAGVVSTAVALFLPFANVLGLPIVLQGFVYAGVGLLTSALTIGARKIFSRMHYSRKVKSLLKDRKPLELQDLILAKNNQKFLNKCEDLNASGPRARAKATFTTQGRKSCLLLKQYIKQMNKKNNKLENDDKIDANIRDMNKFLTDGLAASANTDMYLPTILKCAKKGWLGEQAKSRATNTIPTNDSKGNIPTKGSNYDRNAEAITKYIINATPIPLNQTEADRIAKEEAERNARAEARKARAEEKKAKEEADRKAKEEADRKAEAARIEEARKAKREEDKKRKEEEEKEADRIAKEEAEKTVTTETVAANKNAKQPKTGIIKNQSMIFKIEKINNGTQVTVSGDMTKENPEFVQAFINAAVKQYQENANNETEKDEQKR